MTLINYTFMLYLVITCVCFNLKAEVLHWAQFCAQGQLLVENKSSSEVAIWLQKFNPDLVSEVYYSLPSKQTTKLDLSKNSDDERFTLLHFTNSKNLNVKLNCYNNVFLTHPFEGGVFYFRRTDLTENKIWLQNLFPGNNSISIVLVNEKNESIQSEKVSLSKLEQKNYKLLPTDKNWTFIKVTAENRFTAFNVSSHSTHSPQYISPQSSQVDLDAAYFMVEPRNQTDQMLTDSFVIKIKDSAMITKAREQISNPSLEKIVFGRIQKGHGGFNRNWAKIEKPFWSWSVTEVTNISDLGSTACNGVPQLVENQVDHWLQDPGRICFWNYRIKKELSPLQVQLGQ